MSDTPFDVDAEFHRAWCADDEAEGERMMWSIVTTLRNERDEWHRRWWIDKHHGWDSCLWQPQAEHFAEWGYADFDAPSCPHWGSRNNHDSGCCATAEEHIACWERAADHYMASAHDNAERLREEGL